MYKMSLSSRIIVARQARRYIFNYPRSRGMKEDSRDAAKTTQGVAKWYHLIFMVGAWLLLVTGNLVFLPLFTKYSCVDKISKWYYKFKQCDINKNFMLHLCDITLHFYNISNPNKKYFVILNYIIIYF